MRRTLPGAGIEIDDSLPGAADALLSALFLGGDLVLSQVCHISGLEAHMIQNWVARGYLPPPVNKHYSRRQLSRILIINMLRSVLPLDQICRLLSYVNGHLDDISDDTVDDSQLYLWLVELTGDEAPDMQTGRLVFKIREKKVVYPTPSFSTSPGHPDAYDHTNIQLRNAKIAKPQFTRDAQNNLHTTFTISLADSITGADFAIPHFLNRTVTVKRTGMRTPEGTEIEIKGEGMPIGRSANPINWFKNGGTVRRASLFVRFHVEYPRTLDEKQLKLIREALH